MGEKVEAHLPELPRGKRRGAVVGYNLGDYPITCAGVYTGMLMEMS